MKFIRNTILATTLLTAVVNAGLENDGTLPASGFNNTAVVIISGDASSKEAATISAPVQSFSEAKKALEAHFGMSLGAISALQGIVAIGFGSLWYALGLI